jgi:hypothetical protein
MSSKDARQLVRDLRDYFAAHGLDYDVIQRANHWHVVTANGNSVASFGSTPSDVRFRRNAVTQLRRRGIIGDDFR